MNKRIFIIIGGIVGLAVIIGAAWWLASPLFINRTVDETFPGVSELAGNPDLLMTMPAEERAEVKDEVMEAAADMPESQVIEDMPADPIVISQGIFVGADDFHEGSGTATIYELMDGSTVLRLEDFTVTNGPDLHVFLIQGDTMEGSIDLGSLKGNVGDQNYNIPAGTDSSLYTGVSIYCVPFHVTFAAAEFN